MSERVDHGRGQFDEHIRLVLEGQFVSALRLAGATDEILSKALSDSGKQNFLDWKYEELEPILVMQHQTKEDFMRDENHALIAVAHSPASGPSDTLDLEEAAYSVIVRASENYDRLDLPRTARMREFDNWFFENVVGV